MEVKAEYKAIFSEEAREHIEEWESSLLDLEKHPEDKELIHQMFRAIHTLKGSAGFVGFEKLQKVTHALESALQDVRDGVTKLTPETVDVLFKGLDLSRRMVESFTAGEEFGEDIEAFLQTMWALSGDSDADRHEAASEQQQSERSVEEETAQLTPAAKPVGEPQ